MFFWLRDDNILLQIIKYWYQILINLQIAFFKRLNNNNLKNDKY